MAAMSPNRLDTNEVFTRAPLAYTTAAAAITAVQPRAGLNVVRWGAKRKNRTPLSR